MARQDRKREREGAHRHHPDGMKRPPEAGGIDLDGPPLLPKDVSRSMICGPKLGMELGDRRACSRQRDQGDHRDPQQGTGDGEREASAIHGRSVLAQTDRLLATTGCSLDKEGDPVDREADPDDGVWPDGPRLLKLRNDSADANRHGQCREPGAPPSESGPLARQ